MEINIAKIEEFRKKKRLPMYRMAAMCGIPASTYHYIMTGKTQPRMSTIANIAKAMKCEPIKLIKKEVNK